MARQLRTEQAVYIYNTNILLCTAPFLVNKPPFLVSVILSRCMESQHFVVFFSFFYSSTKHAPIAQRLVFGHWREECLHSYTFVSLPRLSNSLAYRTTHKTDISTQQNEQVPRAT